MRALRALRTRERGQDNSGSDTVHNMDLYWIEEFFAALRSYSLIKFQADLSSCLMYRLIHAWTSDRLRIKEQEQHQPTSIFLLKHALHNERHHSPSMTIWQISRLISFDHWTSVYSARLRRPIETRSSGCTAAELARSASRTSHCSTVLYARPPLVRLISPRHGTKPDSFLLIHSEF